MWEVFNNFLLIDATDRIKISGDQKRFFIALSLYPLSFFANTPFKRHTFQFQLFPHLKRTMHDSQQFPLNRYLIYNKIISTLQQFPLNRYLINNKIISTQIRLLGKYDFYTLNTKWLIKNEAWLDMFVQLEKSQVQTIFSIVAVA